MLYVAWIGSHSVHPPNPLPLLKMATWSILDCARFSHSPNGMPRHPINHEQGPANPLRLSLEGVAEDALYCVHERPASIN